MKKFLSTILLLAMVLSLCSVCALASEYSFEITAISYTDGNLTALEEMKTGDNIFIAPTVKKTDTSSVQPTVLTAVYNESGALCKTFISRAAGMTNGVSLTFANEYTLPENFENYMVKAFVFADLATATAAAKSVSKALDAASNTPVPDSGNSEDGKTVTFASEDVYDSKTSLSSGKTGSICVFTDKSLGIYETYDVAISALYINDEKATASDFADYVNSNVMADIRLVSDDSDIYTTAYITIYTDVIVSDVNINTYRIYGEDGGLIILDETNADYNFTIYKNGAEASVADIQIGDVISYAGIKNSGNKLESGIVVISSDNVVGTVTAYNIDDCTLAVDGTAYKYNPDMLSIGSGTDDNIDIGDYAMFYINHRGYICGCNSNIRNVNLKYGFATLLARETGINSGMQVRIFDEVGEWNTYGIASSVSINGGDAQQEQYADWASATGKTSNSGGYYVINTVIGYVLNDSNEISTVYFKDDNDKFNITDKSFCDCTYYEDVHTLGGVTLDEETLIFSVAGKVDLTQDIEEDSVMVGKRDGLVNRQTYSNGYIAYNIDASNAADVILGKDLLGAINYAGNFFTISSVSTALNAEGAVVKELKGICEGEEVSLTVSANDTVIQKVPYEADDYYYDISTEAATIGNLAKGTVIIYSKNANGEARNVVILADVSDIYSGSGTGRALTNTMLGKKETFYSGGEAYTFLFGYVSGKSGSSFYVYDELGYKTGYLVADPALSVSGVTGAMFDPFSGTAAGIVSAATAGDINYGVSGESADEPYGDIIFAKVKNDIIVEDFVVFRSGN